MSHKIESFLVREGSPMYVLFPNGKRDTLENLWSLVREDVAIKFEETRKQEWTDDSELFALVEYCIKLKSEGCDIGTEKNINAQLKKKYRESYTQTPSISNSKTRRTKKLLLTGSDYSERLDDVLENARIDISDYLGKPLDSVEVEAELQKLLKTFNEEGAIVDE